MESQEEVKRKSKLSKRVHLALRIAFSAAFISSGVPWLWIFLWTNVPGPLFFHVMRGLVFPSLGDERVRPTSSKLLFDYSVIALCGLLGFAADSLLVGSSRILLLACVCSFSPIGFLSKGLFAAISEKAKANPNPRPTPKSPPSWVFYVVEPAVFFYLLNGGKWPIAVATSVLLALALGAALGASEGLLNHDASQRYIKFSATALLATAFLSWASGLILYGPIRCITIASLCMFATSMVVCMGCFGAKGCCGGSCSIDSNQKNS